MQGKPDKPAGGDEAPPPTTRVASPFEPPPRGGDDFTRTLAEQPSYDQPHPPAAKEPYLTMIAGAHPGAVVKLPSGEAILGRSPEATLRIDSDGVSWKHACIFPVGDGRVIEDLKSTNGTGVNDRRVERHALVDGDRIHLGPGVILRFCVWDQLEASMQQQLYESAVTDPLTHAYNRKHFQERLRGEINHSRRHHAPVSLITFDLDHFKRVNDEHGHPAGDLVLRSIAAAILGVVRAEDVFARVGGEEFAIVARATDEGQAMLFAERLRAGIAGMALVWGEARLPITASFGVATSSELSQPDADQLIALADTRLYQSKHEGRNRVSGPR